MVQGYITVAFGPQKYIELARTLIRSIKRIDPNRPVALVTDRSADAVPEADDVIPLRSDIGDTLLHKMHLDLYSPYDETMFIDADCVLVRDPDGLWALTDGHSFGMLGSEQYEGEWFGADIADIRKKLQLDGALPKFNSGQFTWKRSDLASEVFRRARETWPRYRDLGFGAFRSDLYEADEPLIAIGMALSGVRPVPASTEAMFTPAGAKKRVRLSLYRGVCTFDKPGHGMVNPRVAHFGGSSRLSFVYARETLFLRYVAEGFSEAEADRRARRRFAVLMPFDHRKLWALRFKVGQRLKR